MAVSSVAFGYMTNLNVGGWWAAIFVISSGLMGVVGYNKGVAIAGLVFSTVAVILTVVAGILDGMAYDNLSSLETCANVDTGVISGNEEYEYYAALCTFRSSSTCTCVKGAGSSCYLYTMAQGNNCDKPLTVFPNLLFWSTMLCVLGFMLVFTSFVVGCHSLCGFGARSGEDQELTRPKFSV